MEDRPDTPAAGSLVGPALGGALVAATGSSTWAFSIDAATFAVSALTLLLIPPRPASGSVAAVAAEMAATSQRAETEPNENRGVLAFLKKSRALQVILVVVIAANLAGGGIDGVAPRRSCSAG
jgi:hypothetical protein